MGRGGGGAMTYSTGTNDRVVRVGALFGDGTAGVGLLA